jgi:hypothetical protein
MMSRLELLQFMETVPYPIRDVEDLFKALPEESRTLKTLTNLFSHIGKYNLSVNSIIEMVPKSIELMQISGYPIDYILIENSIHRYLKSQ